MPIGAAIIAAKEAAKKTIKETAKQIAKETKKDVLKGKLKQAVKAKVKEEIKDKVVEEIDDKVMDVGAVRKASEIAKGDGLKGKLTQAVKGEARERVMDDINENVINVGAIQKGKTALDAAKTSDGASEKVNASDSNDGKNTESMAETRDVNDKTSGSTDMPEKSLKDKLSEAVRADADHKCENSIETKFEGQKSDIITDDKDGDKAEKGDGKSDLTETNETNDTSETNDTNDTSENNETKEAIKNKLDGLEREAQVAKELEKKYPPEEGYQIVSEAYLRDKDGNIVKDPVTGEARRVDFMVVKDGKVVDSIEVTSKTADKTEQSAKENRIREAGGNYIRDNDGNLVEIPSTVQTRIERRD